MIILWYDDDKIYEAYVSFVLHRIVVYESGTNKHIFKKTGVSDTDLRKFIRRVKTFKKIKLKIIHKNSQSRQKGKQQ